jgi:histidinol-phosphate aminotransferase
MVTREEADVMSLILPHIERMSRYETGLAPQDKGVVLKLNQNENPYPPSPCVREALRTADADSLRCYPDGSMAELRAALSLRYGTIPEQVFMGNGSSEIISLIMKVFVGPQASVALPDPTFGLYHTAARAQGAYTVPVPLNSRYEVDVDGLLESGAKALVLVNPNAPTGLLLEEGEVRRLVKGFPGLVVVDEAYMDFAEHALSAIPLIFEAPNLIVLRTFSKSYGLCGARVGCCFASRELIAALEKGKDIYNINAVSARLALAALRDSSYMEQTAARIRRTRDYYTLRLAELGLEVLPSSANFLLCRVPGGENGEHARLLYEGLAERGIYVRYFDHPVLQDKLRISVGTDEDMERLFGVVRELLA